MSAGVNTALVAALTGDADFTETMGKLFDRNAREVERAQQVAASDAHEQARRFARALIRLHDAVDLALEEGKPRIAERALDHALDAVDRAARYLD